MSFFSKCFLFIETHVGRVTGPIERFSHRYLLAPIRWVMSKIDPLSYAIEGTVFRKILQVSIYPVIMVLTVVVGFELVENGYTKSSFIFSVLSFMVLGAIFAPLERLIPFSRKWFDDKDEPVDAMLFFGNSVWARYINNAIELATVALVVQEISPSIGHDIWPSDWHPIAQVLLLLCIYDFFRYWYHRWMHENEFMWRWHSIHHSSERLYWFNGVRSHPIEGLISNLLWALPLAFVKAPVEIAFVTALLGKVIGRFQHTNMDLILGPFDYIFSTPKNHRYHHSKKVEEGNSNYGGDVIIWDLLFGTFYLPKGKQPSDEIGLADMPNYPQTWIGLMLAPFTYGRLKQEAQKISNTKESILMDSNETPDDDMPRRKQA